MRARARSASVAAALVVAVLLAGACPAAAQCTYSPLTAKSPATAASGLQYYYFTPVVAYWGVVGVRPNAAGEDWDISVWQHTAPYPDCVSSWMMSSEQYGPQMDFVIGDFNSTPLNTYEVAVTRWAGSGTGLVEWYGGSDLLSVNAARVEKSLGPAGPIHVYDVNLTAGTTYTLHFSTKGTADLHLCVFENAGGAAYFGNRAGAALETGGCATYTPSVSGWHGLAVVCDWGEGTYELGVTTGSCTCPTPLADGVPVDVGVGTSLFAMPQNAYGWSAVGVRYDGTLPASYLEVYSEPYGSPAPDCLSGLLASDDPVTSGRNYEVLAADFSENYPRTDYALVYADADVKTEWTQSSGFLFVNDQQLVVDGVTANDVLDVYEIYLQAGHNYRGTIASPGYDSRLMVYAPSPGAPFGASLLLNVVVEGNFTAPTNGWYGVAVVNAAATAGAYAIEFRECKAVTALANGVPHVVYGDTDLMSFAQADGYWTGVAVRDPAIDFNIWTAARLGSGNYPDCTNLDLATSVNDPPVIDYVVGDFNHIAPATCYAAVYAPWDFSLSGDTVVEWDAGPDQMPTNGSAVRRTWAATEVLDVYDVWLLAGRTYIFRTMGPDTRLDFFSTPETPYWASVDRRLFSISSGGSYSYTAPASDWYGVVLVHTAASTYSYQAWVQDQTLGVDDSAPLVTGLTSLEPNPARGLVRLEYALRERGSVGFRVFDMAGREVWRSAPEAREAGRWSAQWSGTDASGRRLAPGLYFLHMAVDDRPIALRRLTLLR